MNYAIISLRLYVTILLALVTVVGDALVSHSKIRLYKAVFDNTTHSVIGGLSWFLVCICCKRITSGIIVEVIICAIISSFIDLDHFVIAKSLSLEDATNLNVRPPLHCSTFPILLSIFLLLSSYVMKSNFILISGLILLTSFLSHHTRDATRRGYWLYPFGSTPPIPYMFYVLITCSLPYVMFFIHKYLFTVHHYQSGSIFYEI